MREESARPRAIASTKTLLHVYLPIADISASMHTRRPKITKEFIIFTLNKFRNLDMRFEKNKGRLIDGLVKAIFVYEDYIKLILTFDDKPINIPTSDEIENMANSSDIQSNVS